ncbi:hypothetical protein MTR_5g460710 [Medicago truncatula]|uniref:Uncharacterized protein n=1 Tax=Medicago truncatula TaxID=3880 RepID=A0A072UE26_MEDTR|nr:hypothetical protein MTR_5g460710 [Medicago truncatula]
MSSCGGREGVARQYVRPKLRRRWVSLNGGGEAESELQGFGRDCDNGVGSRRLKGKGDVDIRIDT